MFFSCASITMPALLTRQSTRPHLASVASTIGSRRPRVAHVGDEAEGVAAGLLAELDRFLDPSGVRSQTTTFAPSRANFTAVA